MNITDIRIRKILTGERLRAIVSITIDDILAIHDIKIIQGTERLFVAMPSRREESGIFRDVVHPISGEARKMIEDAIISEYNNHLEKTIEQHGYTKAEVSENIETEMESTNEIDEI